MSKESKKKSRGKLFEYAVLAHKKDKDDNYSSEIVINNSTKLAESEHNLKFDIIRSIPEQIVDDYGPENIEILIRPF